MKTLLVVLVLLVPLLSILVLDRYWTKKYWQALILPDMHIGTDGIQEMTDLIVSSFIVPHEYWLI